MMPLQRACDAESQVRNKLSNGPLRVQSNVLLHRVFCNVLTYVSCREYVCILLSVRIESANQGGTTDKLFVLDSILYCQGFFVLVTQIFAMEVNLMLLTKRWRQSAVNLK